MEFPNCIFAAITSARSLRFVPNDLANLEKSVDITDLGNVKYHQAVSQIGVEDLQELAQEEFGIVSVDGDKARELIELARGSAEVTDIQVLRNLLASPTIREVYLAGGG